MEKQPNQKEETVSNAGPNPQPGVHDKKTKISKYDLIKIKVFLGQHWFVFSRYILAGILQVIHINERDSQKIAYLLKKKLVEQGLTTVSLGDFQVQLFNLLFELGYDQSFKNRYLMMNKFYSNRAPLIILIAGSVLVGKSSIANQLSERINISNVLQTKIVSYVMSALSPEYNFLPFWKHESTDECLKNYIYESEQIRKGCSLDMIKAYKEGKPVILEGHHIIPTNFIDKNDHGEIVLHTLPNLNETLHEKSIREEIQSLKTKGLIIPFLITLNEDSHREFLNNDNLLPPQEKQHAFEVFRGIQDYLIKNNNYFIEIDGSNSNQQAIVESIHRKIIDTIEQRYNEGFF